MSGAHSHSHAEVKAMPLLPRLGFIGSGVMASALISGLTRSGLFTADRIIASDPFASSRDKLKEMGIRATDNNLEVVTESNIIIIAVKPNVCYQHRHIYIYTYI
jgi:pyrroline-5-carboxylate reductase